MRIINSFDYSFSNIYGTNSVRPNQNRSNYYFSPQFVGKDRFVKSISSVQDVIGIFDKQAAEVPIGLNLKVSPKTGKILGFSKILDNGNLLNVIKTASDSTQKGLLYLLFKETKDNQPIKTIGIDVKSGELLKLHNGKARVSDGELEKLNFNDSEYAISGAKMDNYIKQLSKHDNYQENATTVEVLKVKKQSKPLNLDNILDDVQEMPDDKAFAKMISRDIEMGEREREKAKERFLEDANSDFNNFMINDNEPKTTILNKNRK